MPTDAPHQTLILKISGESLSNPLDRFDVDGFTRVADQIRVLVDQGFGCVVVPGGGNIFRGQRDAGQFAMTDEEADRHGMIATGMNADKLRGLCRKEGIDTQIVGRGPGQVFGPNLTTSQIRRAIHHKTVCIIAGGSGEPGVSTDVPAVQLAVELSASKVIMSKHGVDGIYTADPHIDTSAVRLPRVTATIALNHRLAIMDAKALDLCRASGIPIHIVPAASSTSLIDAAHDSNIGSKISPI